MALKVKCYEQTNSRLMCLDKRNLDMVFVVEAVKQRHNNALTIYIISMLNFGLYLLTLLSIFSSRSHCFDATKHY